MEHEMATVVGSLVLAWFVGLATGFVFRGVKNIIERASRP